MIGAAGDPGVPTYVAQASSNGSIGIMEYSWALTEGLPVANLLNAAGYYTAPTPANVGLSLLRPSLTRTKRRSANLAPVYADADPRAYELSYYSYLIVSTDLSNGMTDDKGYTLGAFAQYALCQGQQGLGALGYAPLPINLVEDGFSQLAEDPRGRRPRHHRRHPGQLREPHLRERRHRHPGEHRSQPAACDQLGAVNCPPAVVSPGRITSTSLSATPDPAYAGGPVTVQAVVTGDGVVPPGTVEFLVGSTLLGNPVTVDASGVASTTAVFAATGTVSITADFIPTDSTAFAPSSAVLSLSVTVPPNTIPLAVTDPPNGTFSLTVDTADVVTLAVSGLDATAPTTGITVSDTRNTYPGWTVWGQAMDFAGSGTAAGATMSGSQLGWTPDSVTSPLANGVIVGSPVSPVSPGLGATPEPLAWAPAGAGDGFGTTVLSAGLDLKIPPSQAAGPYTGGLEITALTTGPGA